MAAQSLDVDCIKIHVCLCWEQRSIVREGQLVGGYWDGIVGKSQTSHILGKRQLTYWSKDQPLSTLKKIWCIVKLNFVLTNSKYERSFITVIGNHIATFFHFPKKKNVPSPRCFIQYSYMGFFKPDNTSQNQPHKQKQNYSYNSRICTKYCIEMILHQRFHYMLHKDCNLLKEACEDYIINPTSHLKWKVVQPRLVEKFILIRNAGHSPAICLSGWKDPSWHETVGMFHAQLQSCNQTIYFSLRIHVPQLSTMTYHCAFTCVFNLWLNK